MSKNAETWGSTHYIQKLLTNWLECETVSVYAYTADLSGVSNLFSDADPLDLTFERRATVLHRFREWIIHEIFFTLIGSNCNCAFMHKICNDMFYRLIVLFMMLLTLA